MEAGDPRPKSMTQLLSPPPQTAPAGRRYLSYSSETNAEIRTAGVRKVVFPPAENLRCVEVTSHRGRSAAAAPLLLLPVCSARSSPQPAPENWGNYASDARVFRGRKRLGCGGQFGWGGGDAAVIPNNVESIEQREKIRLTVAH